MEESKEDKEAEFNKKHWWESCQIKYEDLEERAEHWTLGADAATAALLQQISGKMIAKTHEVEAALKNVCEDVDDLHVSLSNAATSLHLLSNMQFTENRTYQEDESTKRESLNAAAKTEEPNNPYQDDAMAECCQAIAEGLQLVKNSYLKMEISDSESEGGEDLHKQGTLTVYKHINPYENRKLPHIIGSSLFFSDETLGLVEIDEELENNDEKLSITSSVSGDDGGEKVTNGTSSQPIVAHSSKIEGDEDSDSDGSFRTSSKNRFQNCISSTEESLSSDLISGKENSTSRSFFQPPSNGILFDSDEEGGPLFGPSSKISSTRISSPSPRHSAADPLFEQDPKNDKGNPPPNPAIEHLVKSSREHRRREKSSLFDLSDDDDDEDLFFTNKSDRISGIVRKEEKGKEKEHHHSSNKTTEDQRLLQPKQQVQNQNYSQHSNDILKSDDTQVKAELDSSSSNRKKPVGGINIFNTAVTKAIEKQQLSGSGRTSPLSGDGLESSNSKERIGNVSLRSEKEEENLFLPKSDDNTRETSRVFVKPALPSNFPKSTKHKTSNSLFSEDDDDGLFSAPSQPIGSNYAQSTNAVKSSQQPSPYSEKSKSLKSERISENVKSDQRINALDSIFGDSDEDNLFAPVRSAPPSSNIKVVTRSNEPPPLPESSSLVSNKKSPLAKKGRSRVGIFSSSSSDDDIFTSSKSRAQVLGTKKIRKNSLELDPETAIKGENNPHKSSQFVAKPGGSTPTSSSNDSSSKNKTLLTSASSSSTKGNVSITVGQQSSLLTKKSSKLTSLFLSSDEDDIFTPKLKESNEVIEETIKTKSIETSISNLGPFNNYSSENGSQLDSSESSSKNVPKNSNESVGITNDIESSTKPIAKDKDFPFSKNDSKQSKISEKENSLFDSSEEDIFFSSKNSLKPKSSSSNSIISSESSLKNTLGNNTNIAGPSKIPNSDSNLYGTTSEPQIKTIKNNSDEKFEDLERKDVSSDFNTSRLVSKSVRKLPSEIESSDDDLFINRKEKAKDNSSNSIEKTAPKQVDNNDKLKVISKKESNIENVFTKNTLGNMKNNYISSKDKNTINNNNGKKPNNISKQNIFQSDSEEDIFKTSKQTKTKPPSRNIKLFSDSDEDNNEDIFSTSFKSKQNSLSRSSIDKVDNKNFGNNQHSQSFEKQIYSQKTAEKHDNLKPVENSKTIEKQTEISKDKLKTEEKDHSRMNFNQDPGTLKQEVKNDIVRSLSSEGNNSLKNTTSTSLFDDDDEEDDNSLFRTSSNITKSTIIVGKKTLQSFAKQNEDARNDSTDGNSKINTKKTLGKIPLFEDGDSHPSIPNFKEKNRCPSTSLLDKKPGEVPSYEDDNPSPSSPIKKPVGGVALFGGEELLSKLKSRRETRGSESENEDPNGGKTHRPPVVLPPSSLETSKCFFGENSYSVSHPVKEILQVNQGFQANSAPSTSQEPSSSFDSNNRSDLLVNLNKDRAKIQHSRKPPSRLRKNSSRINVDLVSGEAKVDTSSVPKDIIDHKNKTEDFSTDCNKQTLFAQSKEVDINPKRNVYTTNKKQDIPNPDTDSSKAVKKFASKSEKEFSSQTKETSKKRVENPKEEYPPSLKKGNSSEISVKKEISASRREKSPKGKASGSTTINYSGESKECISTEIKTSSTVQEKTSETGKKTVVLKKVESMSGSEDIFGDEKGVKNVKKSSSGSKDQSITKRVDQIFNDEDDDSDDIFSFKAKSSKRLVKKSEKVGVGKVSDKSTVTAEKKRVIGDEAFTQKVSDNNQKKKSKISAPSTNIFGEDDEDSDSLFNVSTNKNVIKTVESNKIVSKGAKDFTEKIVSKTAPSIFSDDDDEDNLFPSTSKITPTSTKVIAPPKGKTGKTTARHLPIFDDDDEGSETDDLFSSSSKMISKTGIHPKRDASGAGKNTPSRSLSSKTKLSKERAFVDPLTGNLS